QTFRQLSPCLAAVRGFEKAAALALPLAVFPRALAGGEEVGEDDVRVGRIEFERDRPGVFILVQNFLPSLTAVGRAEDASFFIRSVRMAEHGDEDSVGVMWIDDDGTDLLAVFQPHVPPGLAAVGGFVNAVPGRK